MTNEYQTEPRKVAAVIHFADGVDIERVQAWIEKLQAAGHVENATVGTYSPMEGAPVWYIP